MANDLQLYPSLNNEVVLRLIPESHRYAQNYRISRIKLPPIDITKETAEAIIEQITHGVTAVILGDHLVMCNSIAGIDPLPLEIKPTAVGEYLNKITFERE